MWVLLEELGVEDEDEVLWDGLEAVEELRRVETPVHELGGDAVLHLDAPESDIHV